MPVSRSSGSNKIGGRIGAGRPKGSLNKTTATLKEAILKAAEGAGGGPPEGLASYLQAQALANPGPFMGLLGKVLPLQVAGDEDNPIRTVNEIVLRGVQAKEQV